MVEEGISARMSLEERKVRTLIKLRGYRLIERDEKDSIISFLVEAPKDCEKILIWCIKTEEAAGVRRIEQLKKAVDAAEADKGMVVAHGKYTQAAKVKAKESGIELIPRDFPSFNIFDHVLVPKHEILTPEEKEQILEKFRVEAHQLPKIRASDPAVISIGGKPGDVLRIIRKSPTAGIYVAYRYVVS